MNNNDIEEILYKEIGKKNYINYDEKTIVLRSETIGKILKFLRTKIGITQKTVADNIGIAQQTYAGYESGKHEPSIEIAIRLANFYDLSMDYITGRFIDFNEGCIEEHIMLDEILENSRAFYASLEENAKTTIKAFTKNAIKK